MSAKKTFVLFVCMGNICRSPAAECFFRIAVENAGINNKYMIESAGTGSWHAGADPDRRMRASAKKKGLAIAGSARQICVDDFSKFDWIFCMDKDNLHDVLAMGADPDKTKLFLPYVEHASVVEVPDPYYGGEDGFEEVVDLLYETAHALLKVMESA